MGPARHLCGKSDEGGDEAGAHRGARRWFATRGHWVLSGMIWVVGVAEVSGKGNGYTNDIQVDLEGNEAFSCVPYR